MVSIEVVVFSCYSSKWPWAWLHSKWPDYWWNNIACYTEEFHFLLIQLFGCFPNVMVPPFSHGSQNSTVASVIAVYRHPGLRCSLQVTGFVRIKVESLAATAQSPGLSYRPLRMCVCVCLEWSEVFYCTRRVCEITFVLVRLVQCVQGLSMKLICAGHCQTLSLSSTLGARRVCVDACIK